MAQKKQIGVRVPDGLRAFLKRRAQTQRTTEAATYRDALETFREICESLGNDWWEIDRRANSSEMAMGRVIGELAKAALDLERRPKK